MQNKINNISELDSINTPLEGITLIEAAAGTGKTHNIQNIAARLIVECNYPINSIVIVTFTELAAQELSERLRSVLESLAAVLQNRVVADVDQDERAVALVKAFQAHGVEPDKQLERVKNALADFDDNRVSTIHGFCWRILCENAFESSILFQVRLERDIDQYIDKLLNDFCRSKRYSNSKVAAIENITAADIADAVKFRLNRSNIKCEYTTMPFESEAALTGAMEDLISELKMLPDAVDTLLNIPGTLNKIGDLPGRAHVEKYAGELAELLGKDDVSYSEWSLLLGNISATTFSGSIKKNKDNIKLVSDYLAAYRLFALADEFSTVYNDGSKLFLTEEAFRFVRQNLEAWKARENFQSFDDLLKTMADALKNEQLCKLLAGKFNAGIIDEFQDTDPLQYEIFKKIFVGARERHALFMVGDPRQAIYSFRGGDLAAYMAARQECLEAPDGRIFKLSYNYRSSGKMIGAFNEFFQHNNLFAAAGLALPETLAPPEAKSGIFYCGRELENPLDISYLPQVNAGSFYTACAWDIADMLNNGDFMLPDGSGSLRAVQPGDIAVLAFDKYELESVRKELIKLRVPVVSEHKNGIWSSNEAGELATFLQAVLDCRREGFIRQALLTRLCGIELAGLDNQKPDIEEKINAWRADFETLHRIWQSDGISGMLSRALAMDFAGDGKTFKLRMAQYTTGSRSIANFIQLGDMLAAMELAGNLPPRGVLNYLRDRIARGDVDDESAEMLESDRTAVKLITIHSSKGLQFPVVFIPFLASRYPGKRDGLKSYHRGNTLCCNPDNCDPDAAALALKEEMQELLRLAYVAVTRACNYCFIGWGKNKSKDTSVMDWLFRMRNVDFENTSEDISAQFLHLEAGLTLPEAVIPQSLCCTRPLPVARPEIWCDNAEKIELEEPPEVKVISNDWRLISYSALSVNGSAEKTSQLFDEAMDYDQDDCDNSGSSGSAETLAGGIWDIPGGAAIGNAWHNILEVMDFTAPVDPAEVKRIMNLYGFDNDLHAVLTCQMLEKLMFCTLGCSDKLDNASFCLHDITAEHRISEFEFLLNASGTVNMHRILDALQDYFAENYRSVYSCSSDFFMHGGFFTGFIDLLVEHNKRFYIIDWKSNTLDRDPENFYGDKLKKAMFDATYPLQYLCYTAALVKYLEQRLQQEVTEDIYEQYFGGVYYIFLRGMLLPGNAGIYEARPPLATVRKLLDALGCPARKEYLCR